MNTKYTADNDAFSDKLVEIVEETKKRCMDKEYFSGLNFDKFSIIELITKDYLQCLSLYIETGSKETFIDKICWFKVMASGRMPLRNSKDDLLDFLNILKSITLEYIKDSGKTAQAFNDFSQIIESVYCEV